MRPSSRLIESMFAAALMIAAPSGAVAQGAAANACLTCHATLQDARLSVPAARFSQQDVHREQGFACVDCHGGNPAAAETRQAHDTGRGFKGKPAGPGVIATCARCHGDANALATKGYVVASSRL